MNQSLFIEYIDKFFRLVVGKITEKINGKKVEEQLLHKTMLTEEYSADLTWGSTELNTSIVAADVVALDSTLEVFSSVEPQVRSAEYSSVSIVLWSNCSSAFLPLIFSVILPITRRKYLSMYSMNNDGFIVFSFCFKR